MIAADAIGPVRFLSAVLTGTLLFCFLPERAAAQCPTDFLDAGEVSAAAGAGRYQEVNVTKDLLLPKGIRIDASYRQKSIQAAGDGAASDMRAVQIPPGIHLIPGGRSGGAWWSIDNPKLEAASVDEHNNVSQWKFKIDLYANSGGRVASPPSGRGGGQAASDVRVRVCVKVER
jgi:hypothetical protein